MKQKLQALDVTALVTELHAKLLGMRLQNVYDISSKLYLWKFARPDHKENILVESGIRIHSTDYARDKTSGGVPGSFCMKLRKHLRTKRLTALRQLGVDRVIDFQFGSGEAEYHVLMEFYAAGNIILTDNTYTILSLLRVVSLDEETRFAVGERYNVDSARLLQSMTQDRLVDLLQTSKSVPKVDKEQIKKFLGNRIELPAPLIEHCLLRADIPGNAKVSLLLSAKSGQMDMDAVRKVNDALQLGYDMVQQAMQQHQQGYIILKPVVGSAASAQASNMVLTTEAEGVSSPPVDGAFAFEEFHPFLYAQFENGPYKVFESYNRTLDVFFSSIETQKLDMKARQHEELAVRRLEQVRKEQESRIEGLQAAQITNEQKAQMIELNLERVEQALMVLQSAIATGMDWVDLERLVDEEKKNGNPVASLITELKLKTNQAVLTLHRPTYEDAFGFSDDSDEDGNDEDEWLPKSMAVEVDLGLSAYANARRYFDMKKASAVKQEKTIQSTHKALKNAEKQVNDELKKARVKPTIINKIRKPFWFERFNWFISTENYLVIGGKDAQQNEFLVKRHLRKGDAYVHADLAGSSSVIVKNPSGEPISPVTLAQAGTMALCHSRAWENKVVTSAWWVHHDQVSKAAPTGEYLTTGSFMIRGKKNYLPPSQLVYGFGFMFRVADECIGRHLQERRPHLRGAGNSDESLVQSSVENTEEAMVALDDADESVEASTESIQTPVDDGDPIRQQRRRQDDTMSFMSQTADKYNLEELNDAQPDAYMDVDMPDIGRLSVQSTSDAPRRKYTSAKQRRKERKGDDVAAATTPGEPAAESTDDDSLKPRRRQTDQKQKKEPAPAPPPPAPKAARGQNKKNKKRKEKYADQDDEDRELMMKLLGSEGQPQKKPAAEPSSKQGAGKPPKQSSRPSTSTAETNPLARDSKGPVQVKSDAVEKNEDLPETDEVLDAADAEEIKRMLEEEKVVTVDEEENLSFIDALTGQPVEEDILLSCIPVCAPYNVLQNYKYRVKLLPGGLKKGKACKSILQSFLTRKDISPVERDLIRAVPEPELISCMMAKVKILAPGILDQMTGNKRRKK